MHIHLGLSKALRGQDVRESEKRGSPQKRSHFLTKDKKILRHHVEEPAKLYYRQKKMHDNKQARKESILVSYILEIISDSCLHPSNKCIWRKKVFVQHFVDS
jgi:hypothetical protein